MGIEAFGLRPSHPLCYAMLKLQSNLLSAQESRAVARKPRDVAAILFRLQSPTTFTTSIRVAELRKRGFRAPNIPAQNNLTQNGHSRSFKVTCFGVSGKAIRDIIYNNVGLIC